MVCSTRAPCFMNVSQQEQTENTTLIFYLYQPVAIRKTKASYGSSSAFSKRVVLFYFWVLISISSVLKGTTTTWTLPCCCPRTEALSLNPVQKHLTAAWEHHRSLQSGFSSTPLLGSLLEIFRNISFPKVFFLGASIQWRAVLSLSKPGKDTSHKRDITLNSYLKCWSGHQTLVRWEV